MTDATYSPLGHKGASRLDKATGRFRGNGFRSGRERSNGGRGWLLFQRADETTGSGVYYPETLKSMGMAFDLAWKHMSVIFEDRESARQILAVQILHHVDRGEHNVGRLATAATDDLIALTGVFHRDYPRGRSASVNAYAKQTFVDYRSARQV
jgi:hypothetical protein